MRTVNVQELEVGQTIAGDVVNAHGQVILPAGTVMGPRLHTLLRAWGIAMVDVHDAPIESSDVVEEDEELSAGAPIDIQRLFGNNDLSHPMLAKLASMVERQPTEERERTAKPCASAGSGRSFTPVPKSKDRAWPPMTPETIVARVGTLASLPSVYYRVDRVINHASSSASDIAAVLNKDQALCARLLRIGNSAFYGFSRRVEGIDEAVRIIGTRQLHDLVLGTVVLTHFKGVDPKLVTMQSFWRHSLACGIAARSIAKLRRENNTERYFVAGLLHDIGSLVLYQQFSERAQAALERHAQSDSALEDAERITVGCDHGAVGSALMTAWTLPQFFREAAAFHHSSGHRLHTSGTAAVHIADLLAVALGLGTNGETRVPRFDAKAWKILGLVPDSLESICQEVRSLLTEAQRTFCEQEAAA